MQLLHRVELGRPPWAWRLAVLLVRLKQNQAHWVVQRRLLLALLRHLRVELLPFQEALLGLVAPWVVHHYSFGLQSASRYRQVSDLAVRGLVFSLVLVTHLALVLLQLLEDSYCPLVVTGRQARPCHRPGCRRGPVLIASC